MKQNMILIGRKPRKNDTYIQKDRLERTRKWSHAKPENNEENRIAIVWVVPDILRRVSW